MLYGVLSVRNAYVVPYLSLLDSLLCLVQSPHQEDVLISLSALPALFLAPTVTSINSFVIFLACCYIGERTVGD